MTRLSLQSTLLKALAGKLGHSGLQVNGNIMYNGTPMTEFLPQRTAVYVEQEDQHLPELTVRETFDFAARCQGVGGKAGRLHYTAFHQLFLSLATGNDSRCCHHGLTLSGWLTSVRAGTASHTLSPNLVCMAPA